MRRCVCCAARRKWGQRTWSPTASSGGAAPTNGVSAQEALQIAYRPMPPSQTVEYEEDFGHNLMIHREFISRRHRDQLTFEMSALAYSDVELRRGRQHLAGIMNRERRGVSVGAAAEAPGDRVNLQTDVDPATREVMSARYLFDEKRLQFCDRFQRFFQSQLEDKAAQGEKNVTDGGDTQYLFSLMEACAVIYGCETDTARETYFRMFLSLDLDSLEQENEAWRQRMADAKLVRQVLGNSGEESEGDNSSLSMMTSHAPTALDEEAFIASVPELSLFQDPQEREEKRDNEPKAPHTACDEKDAGATDADSVTVGSGDVTHAAVQLPEPFEEYAPLYKAYLAHVKGVSGIASYDVSSLGSTGVTAERRRWRALMDKIVREEYHTLTDTEQMDALVLNEQLHTVKFFDLKVGDTVREILQLLQRETGHGSSTHRDTPLDISPNHPERRV